MCGATQAQTQIQTEQIQQMQDYDNMMKQQYAGQQQIYGQVNSVLQPILQAGPNQEGFSSAEKENLNAQAVEGTAENYKDAAQAVGGQLAAEGGGNVPITTGGGAEIKAEIAQSAAQTQSSEESQIQQADYSQGFNEFQNAENEEMGVAAGENPLGWAGATTSAGSAASSTANQIATENNSWINAALGAAGAIGGGLAGDFTFGGK